MLICWLPRLEGPLDLRWDGAVYYVLGTSLAEGRGYRLLNEPGEIEANQYPPMLPAVIAAHQRLLGTNDPVVVGRWLRSTYFLVFIIYILAVYFMARSQLPAAYALATALVCLFSPLTYHLSDLCFPEIPFALTTTLFALSNRRSDKRIYGLLSALLAVAAYALRTAGIALLAAWVVESILKRELRRTALRLGVSAIAVGGWLSYISAVESGSQYGNPAYGYQRANYLYYNVSYTNNVFRLKDPFAPEMGPPSFGDISARFVDNLKTFPASIGESVSSGKRLWEWEWDAFNRLSPLHLSAPWMPDLALSALGCLVIGGVGLLLNKRQWFIPLYILFSTALICLTPWPQQFTRYLAPLVPFLCLSMFTFLFKLQVVSREIVGGKYRLRATVLIAAAVALILAQQWITVYLIYTKWHQRVAYSAPNGGSVAYRLFFYHDAYRALDAGIDWMKLRAKPGDVVASSVPHWVYLRTGLKSVMPPFELDPREAQRLLESVPVDYLIVDEGLALDTRKYTLPVAQTFPDKWKRVYSDRVITEAGEELRDRFQIYERVRYRN